jgi:hypothetical protein
MRAALAATVTAAGLDTYVPDIDEGTYVCNVKVLEALRQRVSFELPSEPNFAVRIGTTKWPLPATVPSIGTGV